MNSFYLLLSSFILFVSLGSCKTSSSDQKMTDKVSNPFHDLKVKALDDKSVSISYTVGGGCEKHKSTINLLKKRNAEKVAKAYVLVLQDLTEDNDPCRRILRKNLTVKFDFATVSQKDDDVIVKYTHGGCPVFDIKNKEETYTIKKTSDKCRGRFVVEEKLRIKAKAAR